MVGNAEDTSCVVGAHGIPELGVGVVVDCRVGEVLEDG